MEIIESPSRSATHDYNHVGHRDLLPLTQGPFILSGKEWLTALQDQYGEDLRGLNLAELEQLPDAGWVQPEQPKPSLWRRLGRKAVLHPSQPGFNFDQCPDFFDGRAYLAALVERYGEGLEDLSPEDVNKLPALKNPLKLNEYDTYFSPARLVDIERRSHKFISNPA